jgi:argininosuccinate lyase
MKLWSKDKDSSKEVTDFTTGQDPVLDLLLAPFDVLGSIAHITMLESIGLLTKDELTLLKKS